MKLMVVKDRNIGGKFVKDFCNAMEGLGHDIYFVFDSYKQQEIPEGFKENINVINLRKKESSVFTNIFTFLKGIFQPSSFRYAKEIRRIKPDAIVCYMLKDIYNVSFLHNHKIPLFLMVHNHPPFFFEPLKKKFLKRKIYSRQLEKVSAYNVLLESYKGIIEKDFPKKPEYVIGNIIDQIPTNEQANLSNVKKIISYVGRIEEVQKRQHLLFEAFGKIAKDFPDWNINLWGSTKNQEYYNRLVKQLEDLEISKQVHFKGFTNDIKAEYRNSDLLAWPAAFEGLSIALADGMAHGLPSIGFSDAPSVNEVIIDGHNGFLVDNVDEFAEKLALLMYDVDLRIKLGQNAVKDVEKYSEENIAKKWNQILLEFVRR